MCRNPIWARLPREWRSKFIPTVFPTKLIRGWIGFISPTAEFTPKRIETTELRSKLVYQVRAYVCNPIMSCAWGCLQL